MKKIKYLLFLLFFLSEGSTAQNILRNYIDSALENNIVLKQKDISLKQADYALQSAKGLFYPNVNFQAGYTFAQGGRNIDLPIGDMLNGVYSTLNQLTNTQKFPQLENESINFLPQNFYDVKLHTEIPIYNAALNYNKKIKAQQVQLSQYEVEIYKRALVEKVKTAYFQYLQSLDAIHIYQSALKLAKENKKVNQSLLDNGKGLPAYVLRAKSQVQSVKAQITAAQQQSDNAKRYFNFLLNRPQEREIHIDITSSEKASNILYSLSNQIDISKREELKELKKLVDIRRNVYQMNKSAYYPSLNGFFDLGSQAENWKFNSQSRYFMAGIQLKVPIFKGFQNKVKVKKAGLSIQNDQLKIQHISKKLKLRGHVAQNKLRTAYHNYLSAQKRLKTAKAYQRLIHKGYQAGSNTYIETIDAENQLTKAKMAVSINRYKMLEAKAKLERATASFSFK